MIRVLLVDDHPLVIDGLRTTFEVHHDIEVAGSAATLADARNQLSARPFVDVALIDIRLPDGSGFQLLTEFSSRDDPAFLLLSSFHTPQYVDAAMRLGAAGFLVKTAPAGEIVAAVRTAAAGMTTFDRRTDRTSTDAWQPLRSRETQIVRGLLGGRSNDEVGADLGISRKTVEGNLSRLFERLRRRDTDRFGTARRAGALARYARGRRPRPKSRNVHAIGLRRLG